MEEINKGYYAIIPADVRYDKSLNANAKLLYGEITALCNEKGYCWASNNYFAKLYGVSKKSISTWVNKLVENNHLYSEIIYKNNSKEILERRLYISKNIIMEKLVPPMEEKVNTPRKTIGEPEEKNFYTPMEEKVKENNTVINNTINNTNNIPSIYLNNIKKIEEKEIKKKEIDMIDSEKEFINYQNYRDFVKDNISYDSLVTNEIIGDVVDDVVELMVDVLTSKAKTIRIGQEEKNINIVKSTFEQLNDKHIEHTIYRFKNLDNNIKNVRAYLISMLFNAPKTMNLYYENKSRLYNPT